MIVSLTAERLNRGLSLRQAAVAIGVPEQSIRRAENGLGVTPANAFLIAQFYGYRVTDLWPVDGPPVEQSPDGPERLATGNQPVGEEQRPA